MLGSEHAETLARQVNSVLDRYEALWNSDVKSFADKTDPDADVREKGDTPNASGPVRH